MLSVLNSGRMKTQDAIKLAGTAKALAELLEITGGAVSQWGEEVPEGRRWQLQVLKPQWFEEQPIKPKAEQGA